MVTVIGIALALVALVTVLVVGRPYWPRVRAAWQQWRSRANATSPDRSADDSDTFVLIPTTESDEQASDLQGDGQGGQGGKKD